MPGLGYSQHAGERGVCVPHGAAIAGALSLVFCQSYIRAGNPLSSPGGEMDAHSLVGLGAGCKSPNCIA